MRRFISGIVAGLLCVVASMTWAQDSAADNSKYILTPPPPATPRINGARVFGVRPGSPVLFHVAATGESPLCFTAEGLPDGVKLDVKTGLLTGKLDKPGTYRITLNVRNPLGMDTRELRLVVGDKIALTPPMGWNSWNCWAKNIDAEKIRAAARAMVDSGLINHGWTYINIDDAWQGTRTGPDHSLVGNERFADMKGLADYVHARGLKFGLYSTPWTISYAQLSRRLGQHRRRKGHRHEGRPLRPVLVLPPGRQRVGRLGGGLPQVRLGSH